MPNITVKWMRCSLVSTVIILPLFLWIIPAQGMTFERLTVNFMISFLTLNPETGTAKLLGDKEFSRDWEVKEVSVRQFHVRRAGWKDFYWNVDTGKHQVQRVTGGNFGQPGGAGSHLKRIMADYAVKDKKGQPIAPHLEITFMPASLVYDPKNGSVSFTGEGTELIDSAEMEATCFTSGLRDICQIRHRKWGKKFWEISLKENKVSWAAEGEFGSAEGGRQHLFMDKVAIQNPRNVAGTFEDLGFTEQNETRRPRSEWIESRKKIYRDLLKNGAYDVLLVPFQIQGYAIDRAGRSLMTRYLADRIAKTTGLRIPDPTLVARALGEDTRTFDEDEIMRLANDLKVKLLIRGSAGHNRDEKLTLTILTQEPVGEGFTSATKTNRLDWRDITFSDEHLPEAVFNEMLAEIMAKLPLRITGRPAPGAEIKASRIALPANIDLMTTQKPASPVIAAYYLQFLGMLYPEDVTAMEHLFERSLIVLNQVSPKSPDYRLLKARALFYLHRRPAALAALGTPLTPEEKGFAALMNGNLPHLKKSVAEMTSPLPKLMANIELIDLRWAYKERVSAGDYQSVIEGLPEWEMLLDRRLQNRDMWYSQSNLVVKQHMDTLFPVRDFSVNDLLTSKIALGDAQLDDPESALSVYEHYHRYLDGNGKKLLREGGDQYLTRYDSLDLFQEIGRANLLQSLKITSENQGLPEEAVAEMAKYEKVYGGHPAMAYLKGTALSHQWQGKKELGYLLTQRDELYYQALYWSGGQVNVEYSPTFPAYDADYPKRPFWSVRKGDRLELKGDGAFDAFRAGWKEKAPGESAYALETMQNMLLSLKYTNDNFYPIKSGYEWLAGQPDRAVLANIFLELKKDRFSGHPDRIQFDAKLGMNVQDHAERIAMLEEAIAASPDLWESYKTLGDLHLRRGELLKARETFLRYPLFKQGAEGNRVAMSNDALGAAVDLWWRGGVDEALPLFRIAAGSQTGSGSEMMGAGILATLTEDYDEAAAHFLRLIKRYKSSQGYREYLSFLHAGGLHQQSWSIFNTVDIQTNSPDILTAAFVGQRMEGKSGAQIAEWLTREHFKDVEYGYLDRYLLGILLTDRIPDRNAADMIRKTMKKLPTPPEEYTATYYRPTLAGFAEGFYRLRTNDFEQAHQILAKWVSTKGYGGGDFAVPYLVFSAIKSKNTTTLNELFRALEHAYDEPGAAVTSKAYFHMAKAYDSGLRGKHQEAIEELRRARYCLPFTRNHPFYPWYQLIETCEWLYKETGNSAYRDLTVSWAKIHQRIKPYFSWAYAVEAKYTGSASDRFKALAIALYLDPNSERIAGFSAEDKAKARKWLEQNKPFQLKEEKPGPWIRNAGAEYMFRQKFL